MFVLVDVGCIECGEKTVVRGVYATIQEAEAALATTARELGIEKRWLFEDPSDTTDTYRGGCDYFTGGQRALEVHEVPSRA